MIEPFLLHRVGHIDRIAEQQTVLLESNEERYNICMLFYCLGKQDAESEEPKYSAFDWTWVEQQFSGLLHRFLDML